MNCIYYMRYSHSLYRLYTSASKQRLIINNCTNNSTRTNFRVQYFSTKAKRVSNKPKIVDPKPISEKENDAFYVVKKGNLIGVYNRFNDIQAQVSNSICDPAVGVYKGYYLKKETEIFLASKGLKNAIYTLNASDLKDDIFGNLVPCPFKEPNLVEEIKEDISIEGEGKTQINEIPSLIEKTSKETSIDIVNKTKLCIIEFDGASKGNPGKAGAGAIIRNEKGKSIAKLCEGLGNATNNVAEYRALLLGLKYAINKGFKNIKIMGDSKLVVKQVKEEWKCNNQNMKELNKRVEELKQNFESFEIIHVKRELNSDADIQANNGVALPDGEVQILLS